MQKSIGYRNEEELRFSNMLSANYTIRMIATCYINVLEMRDTYNDSFPEIINVLHELLIENILTIQNIIAGINDYYGDEQMIETKRYQKIHSIYTSLTGSSTLIERSNKEDCLVILKQFINDKELYDENKGTDYNLIDISMIMSDTRALNHSKIVFH